MTTELNNAGAVVNLNTRQGIDFLLSLGVDDQKGQPVDLTDFTAEAILDDGAAQHVLETTITADMVSLRIPGTLTASLPELSRYSVEIVSQDGIRSSLCYGSVSVDGGYP